MKAWIGKSLIGIAAIHSVFGVIVLGDLIAPALREGVFNTIGETHPAERNMVFWFMVVGVMTMIIGGLIDRMESSGIRIPGFVAWSFLPLTVVGCIMMPASGFWLLWVPTLGLFLSGRRIVT